MNLYQSLNNPLKKEYRQIPKDAVFSIQQRTEGLSENDKRKFMGEFYTPVEYAKKALNYIEKTIGTWREDENYRLWDMSAGTGNLEFLLPSEALDKCYISTLLENAAEIKRRFRKSENKMDYLYKSAFCDKQ